MSQVQALFCHLHAAGAGVPALFAICMPRTQELFCHLRAADAGGLQECKGGPGCTTRLWTVVSIPAFELILHRIDSVLGGSRLRLCSHRTKN